MKPTGDGALQKLGVGKAVPIVTSAVMLDAVAYRGRRLNAGELVTAADITGMLHAQGLQSPGILPGDAVFIHTGWGSLWTDPSDTPLSTEYYSMGPGLALDAQRYLAARTIVLVALDNPFTDPVPTLSDVLPDLPFSVHHNNLTPGHPSDSKPGARRDGARPSQPVLCDRPAVACRRRSRITSTPDCDWCPASLTASRSLTRTLHERHRVFLQNSERHGAAASSQSLVRRGAA